MKRTPDQRGSLILLVMCLVAVMGIALASYLAFSTKTMQLSNRTYAKDVSYKLAEMGLERALRSFSFSTFSSWTLSGITATENLTTSSSPALPSFGTSGITPTVNLKVYHYRTTNKATVWNYYTTYAIDDFVWYQGVWYLCKAAAVGNSQAPSDPTYWTAAPEPWNATANYPIGARVVYNGSAYRCTEPNTNTAPTTTSSYWTSQSAATWSAAATYATDDVVMFGGIPYRCISGHTNQSPPNTTYWLCAPVIYSEGVATMNDSAGTVVKTQLRAFLAPAALFPNALGATNAVTLSASASAAVDSYNQPLAALWDSATPYTPGDVVRLNTTPTYYRCIASHTNHTPPNATYWIAAPLGYSAVVAGGNTGGTAVSVTSAVIGGYVAAPSSSTSPFSHRANFSPGSTTPSLTNSDGTVTAPHSSATKVDLTRVSRSPYIPQFDIQTISSGISALPAPASYGGSATTIIDGAFSLGDSATGAAPLIYNINLTHDDVTGNNFAGLDLYNSGQDITIVGPVILNVSGLFRIRSGSITVNAGASLEIYFTGQLDIGHSIFSTTGIINKTYDPSKVVIVGTSTGNTSTSHYIRTKQAFIGSVYMPNAWVTVTNNNTFANQLYGAISAKNITFSSSGTTYGANLHYDTALRTAGTVGTYIEGPYGISQVRELVNPSERITLP